MTRKTCKCTGILGVQGQNTVMFGVLGQNTGIFGVLGQNSGIVGVLCQKAHGFQLSCSLFVYGIGQADALLSYVIKTLVVGMYTYITWEVER